MYNKIFKIRKIFGLLIIILSVLAIRGIFYPLKIMNLQFIPLLQRVLFDFSVVALAIFILLILITFIFGRLYCSAICPLGIFQEIIGQNKKDNKLVPNYEIKYLISAFCFGALVGGSALLIRYIDPYTNFSSAVSISFLSIVLLIAVGILVMHKNRFFCTNICPAGTVLGLISKISVNKIYFDKEKCISCGQCSNNCPSGCINFKEQKVDNEMCVKCFKCLSICNRGAIKYGYKKEKPVFSIKRRKLLWGIGALALLGAGYAAGINFTKNVAKKFKNIILPAGAKNANNMANKCLNCNLCVNNCPNKILSKANKDFSAVHIDYNLGRGFCEYNCNKCSQICPSGAIQKLTLQQKQHTKIGIAKIDFERCIKCGHCIKDCPTGAIYAQKHRFIAFDGSKCIGCGRCQIRCKADAIRILGIMEQG